VTTDVTKLRRFDREDGSSNSLLPSTSTVARNHVVWRDGGRRRPQHLLWTRRRHVVGGI